MTEPKTNVPKFGSFRPRPRPNAPSAQEPPTDETRHISSKHDREHKIHRHERHRPRSREQGQTRIKTLEVVTSRAPKDDVPDTFIIDRKGDEKNVVYGSNHKYSVPSFRRFGAGYVLGLSSDFRIERDYGDDKGIVIDNWKDSRSKTREKYIFSKVEKEKPRLLKINPQAFINEDAALEMNFVPLGLPRGKKRKRGAFDSERDASGSDRDEMDYRSIYGKTKPENVPSDEEFRYATESESSGSEAGYPMKVDATIQKKNIELSRKVEQFPHDIEAWLSLIDYQDVLIRAGDDHRRITNAELRSIAEIKIHMYEKALEKAKSLEDRERLLLGLMTEGSKIWEVKAQSERWERISNDNIDGLLLWTSYLNFKQSNFSTFRYEEIKELYLSRIKLLTRAIVNANSSSSDQLYYQLIYISLRVTLFMRGSGYSELALAIWQGIFEMNFFGPQCSLARVEHVSLFKDFWESEVPRIGEDVALGWRQFVNNEDSSEAPDATTDAEHNSLDDKHLFESWCAAERLRSESSLPARTMDEVVEDDPFRVILFSDIEEFLIHLPSQAENLRKLCIDAFLLFCRLPIIGSGAKESKKWSLDAFIRDELLECDLKHTKSEPDVEQEDDSTEVTIQSILTPRFTTFQRSPETIFPAKFWFKANSWRERYSGNSGPVPYKWIQNVLKQLTQSYHDEDLAEYYLSFQFTNAPETIKKTAKNILKQYPSSLRLYNAYAMIEWSRNKEVAKGVFTSALSMSSGVENGANNESILLWKSWIWGCLEDGDNSSALGLLLSIADRKPDPASRVSPTLLLRAKQHLSSNQDFLMSSGDADDAIMYAECLALLEYLKSNSSTEPISSNQGDITSAMSIFTRFSQQFQTRLGQNSPTHELLMQSSARLLLHHSFHGPHRPSLLRSQLTEALSLFPQNTIFLTLLAYNERRLRVQNVVRHTLYSSILTPKNDCVTSRFFAIQHEIKYGTIHSAKAAFEHAIASPACKGNAGLWRFYISWLSSVKKFQESGLVKELWYRALRACPWAKELYILGFEKLGNSRTVKGLTFREAKSTWRVMGEKELRVHVDLEERFEEIGEIARRDGEGQDTSEKEKMKLGFK